MGEIMAPNRAQKSKNAKSKGKGKTLPELLKSKAIREEKRKQEEIQKFRENLPRELSEDTQNYIKYEQDKRKIVEQLQEVRRKIQNGDISEAQLEEEQAVLSKKLRKLEKKYKKLEKDSRRTARHFEEVEQAELEEESQQGWLSWGYQKLKGAFSKKGKISTRAAAISAATGFVLNQVEGANAQVFGENPALFYAGVGGNQGAVDIGYSQGEVPLAGELENMDGVRSVLPLCAIDLTKQYVEGFVGSLAANMTAIENGDGSKSWMCEVVNGESFTQYLWRNGTTYITQWQNNTIVEQVEIEVPVEVPVEVAGEVDNTMFYIGCGAAALAAIACCVTGLYYCCKGKGKDSDVESPSSDTPDLSAQLKESRDALFAAYSTIDQLKAEVQNLRGYQQRAVEAEAAVRALQQIHAQDVAHIRELEIEVEHLHSHESVYEVLQGVADKLRSKGRGDHAERVEGHVVELQEKAIAFARLEVEEMTYETLSGQQLEAHNDLLKVANDLASALGNIADPHQLASAAVDAAHIKDGRDAESRHAEIINQAATINGNGALGRKAGRRVAEALVDASAGQPLDAASVSTVSTVETVETVEIGSSGASDFETENSAGQSDTGQPASLSAVGRLQRRASQAGSDLSVS